MGYSFINLTHPAQLRHLYEKGYVYMVRHMGSKMNIASIYYNGANIGYGEIRVIGRIVQHNGSLYVKMEDGDLVPVEEYYPFSGFDKEAWLKYVGKYKSLRTSRAMLIKLSMIKTYSSILDFLE